MTNISFAEFEATAQDRADKAAEVYKYTQLLCQALIDNYIEDCVHSYKRSILTASSQWDIDYNTKRIEEVKQNPDYDFVIESGRKYHKIVMVNNQRSVHAFVDKKTGELYKPAGWKSPAKHVRGNLLDSASREDILQRCDWAGGYLYMR
tara:strand:+ start:2492 stop:2938 length:447 start_codon:yes stop_codon:yes gene_type:complete